jgi:hypothetical protein
MASKAVLLVGGGFRLPSMDRAGLGLTSVPKDVISRVGLQRLTLARNQFSSLAQLEALTALIKYEETPVKDCSV